MLAGEIQEGETTEVLKERFCICTSSSGCIMLDPDMVDDTPMKRLDVSGRKEKFALNLVIWFICGGVFVIAVMDLIIPHTQHVYSATWVGRKTLTSIQRCLIWRGLPLPISRGWSLGHLVSSYHRCVIYTPLLTFYTAIDVVYRLLWFPSLRLSQRKLVGDDRVVARRLSCHKPLSLENHHQIRPPSLVPVDKIAIFGAGHRRYLHRALDLAIVKLICIARGQQSWQKYI